jgi:oligopeptide/dipeptide ABC transporter ATP-binding protein
MADSVNGEGEVVLSVRDLRTSFKTRRGLVRAVDGVSFEVRRGQTMGIVGESGSGKSVMALSLMRLVPAPGKITGGQVLLRGMDLLQLNERQMEDVRGSGIALILQDPMTSLNPVLTIGDQIVETLQAHRRGSGVDKHRLAVDLLRLVRVPDPEDRMRAYPHQLSGGMRQRVAGAIAVACDPAVLIADEPTTALDATTQVQYLRLLRELQAGSGMGMVFITHDFDVVSGVCDQVAVMYAGRMVESGEVRSVFAHPGHPYTRALLAAVPDLEADVDWLETIPGQPPALDALPPGCAFADRCPLVAPRCRVEYPPLVTLGDGHTASCWELT